VASSSSADRVREEGLRLAPWHLQVEITPELTTRDLYEASEEKLPEGFYDPSFVKDVIARLYGEAGMAGRSMLDCACNNGAYLFAAKEAGAGPCFGFDVRQIWIDQARFLAKYRDGPSDDMRFEACDLYDLPQRGLDPVDFTVCAGVLYHVPDPIRAIQVVADLTSDVMLLMSACAPGHRDGAFVASKETTEDPLSGVYGLSWFPTGPAAAIAVLRWLGFQEFRIWDWFAQHPVANAPEVDRFELVAFRDKARVEGWDERGPGNAVGKMRETVATRVPPRSTVLVASEGSAGLLKAVGRPAQHFPQNGAGAFLPGMGDSDSWALMVQIDELRAKGAQYLVVPESSGAWLGSVPKLHEHLQRRFKALAWDFERDGCILYELDAPFFGGHRFDLAA
jgi:tRNA (mo5U34)-methyltransferase